MARSRKQGGTDRQGIGAGIAEFGGPLGHRPRWDPEEVAKLVCGRFEKEYDDFEGPVGLGDYRIWQVWGLDEDEISHVHYGVAGPDGGLYAYRNFQPFGDWLKGAYLEEVRKAEERGSATAAADREAASLQRERDVIYAEKAKTELHRRRMEWVRVGVAAAIILVLLALVFWQVGVRDREGLNVSHLISLFAGAGITYLLGSWVRKEHTGRDQL